MYHRLYHRHMPGEDSLSSRFDYLFEPLDEAESADATVVAASSASDSADDGKSSHGAVPVRMAFAAFVLLPQSEPRPTSPSRSPGGGASDTPATRSPISVALETRQPFPNQPPQQGGPTEGDLLPGVGLPGRL